MTIHLVVVSTNITDFMCDPIAFENWYYADAQIRQYIRWFCTSDESTIKDLITLRMWLREKVLPFIDGDLEVVRQKFSQVVCQYYFESNLKGKYVGIKVVDMELHQQPLSHDRPF